MDALHSFMSPAIARIVRPAPLSTEKVLFAWRMAVGAALARVSRVLLNEDRELVATLDDARWRPELDRSADIILGRVQQLLGDDVVERLVLRSPAATTAGRGRTRRAGRGNTPA